MPASELDRMEAKIRSTESEAAAYQELESESMDAQFRELDYDVDIENELEALKSGGSAVAGELPSTVRHRRRILRRRARRNTIDQSTPR